MEISCGCFHFHSQNCPPDGVQLPWNINRNARFQIKINNFGWGFFFCAQIRWTWHAFHLYNQLHEFCEVLVFIQQFFCFQNSPAVFGICCFPILENLWVFFFPPFNPSSKLAPSFEAPGRTSSWRPTLLSLLWQSPRWNRAKKCWWIIGWYYTLED